MNFYERTGKEIERRIIALIPEHPELLNFEDPHDLLDIGLEVEDLRPSGFQVYAALNAVKGMYNQNPSAVKVV